MKLSLLTTLILVWARPVGASPSGYASSNLRPVGHNRFQEPGPGDKRSPCPALNSLANHGFLPRDGDGLGTQIVKDALYTHFGMTKEVGLLLQKLGLLFGVDPDNYNLEDLFLQTLPYSMFLEDGTNVFSQSKFDALVQPLKKANKRTVTTMDLQKHAVSELVTKRRCGGTFDINLFNIGMIGNLGNFAFIFLFAPGDRGQGKGLGQPQASGYETKTDGMGNEYKEVSIDVLEDFFVRNKFPSDYIPRDVEIVSNTMADVWGLIGEPLWALNSVFQDIVDTMAEEAFWQIRVAELADMLTAEANGPIETLACV